MQWESLEVKDGVLYRLWKTPAGDKVVKQLILPKKLRPSVLQQLHCSLTADHLGVNKTRGRIQERFYWVPCSKDAKAFCKTCDLCASRRGFAKKIGAPLSQYNGAPTEQLAIYVLGPLPLSSQANKYILTELTTLPSGWRPTFCKTGSSHCC